MNSVETWARRNFEVIETDSVSLRYSGQGPPAWRMPMPEIERDLDPRESGDWWRMVQLMDLRRVLSKKMHVLDVGCGPGWPAVALAPYVRQIVAVDKSALAISLITRRLRERGVTNVKVASADASDLPFEDGSFDAVVASELMNVVQDPTSVATEMFRVLKPGGRAVNWVQNFRFVRKGDTELWERSLCEEDGKWVYSCHYGPVDPPDSLELRFEIDRNHTAVRKLRWIEEPTLVSQEAILRELVDLLPALTSRVHLCRDHEFAPETASEPFSAAGFAELTVTPLNHEVCSAFAHELVKRGAPPQSDEGSAACASALLAAMTYVDSDRSWMMSVKGIRPAGRGDDLGRNEKEPSISRRIMMEILARLSRKPQQPSDGPPDDVA